jgi:hypothetical protein
MREREAGESREWGKRFLNTSFVFRVERPNAGAQKSRNDWDAEHYGF